MKVGFITVAYNMPHYTTALVDSVMEQADAYDMFGYIFLHSAHKETEQAVVELGKRWGEALTSRMYRVNRGLARSWNEGMVECFEEHGCDIVFIANDDTELGPGDLKTIVETGAANRDRYMIAVAGDHIGEGRWFPSMGYSMFALNPISYEKIGCFDQNIFPIYFEDVDHHYRSKLVKLDEIIAETHVKHYGSSAINNDAILSIQNISTQRQNGEYYITKWGGLNGFEVYKRPFNHARFNARIDPEVRDAPYPGFDRPERNTPIR